MKKLGIISLLLAASALAFADGNTATGSTGGSVTVVAPISVAKITDLCFGTLVVDTAHFTPGTINVGTDGQLNHNHLGHGTWLFTGTGHAVPSAASFSVTGMDGYPFGFITPPFTVALQDGTQMTIIPNIAIINGLTHGTVSTTVFVGGELALLNGQPGVWSGTFHATAFYL